jgi:hypothetical protein
VLPEEVEVDTIQAERYDPPRLAPVPKHAIASGHQQ